MKIDFDGQVVLITGGTRGIGHRLAVDYAALGANVLITGTDAARARECAKALGRRGQHRGFGVDFTDDASVAQFVAALATEERIDVLVNNAGINRINPVDQVLEQDWTDMQRVNLEGPLRVTKAVGTVMKRREYGRVVNIASIFGVISKAGRVLYSMTKFGLRGLTVASAHDLAPFGVLVNSVSPGFVKTDLTDRILPPAEQEKLAAIVPIGRFAQPEEISRVILFLSSPLNTYITAQNIVVDGGFINA